MKYTEYNGNRYFEDVDKIGDGDLISVKTVNGHLIVDYHGNDNEVRLFFPSKFTTPEIYNMTIDANKFNL